MKVKAVLNNFELGSKIYSTYEHAIIYKNRVNKLYTEVIWEVNDRQRQHLVRLFNYKYFRVQNVEEVN